MSSRCVLDASALLALLHREPGGEEVAGLLAGCAMSTVNWSEVVQKAQARGVDTRDLRFEVEALGVELVPFDTGQAEETARMWATTRLLGLSLGDRACLALAQFLRVPAVTADREWAAVPLDIQVRVIR